MFALCFLGAVVFWIFAGLAWLADRQAERAHIRERLMRGFEK